MDAGEPGEGPGRYPCPWCAAPDAWPDRCTEGIEIRPGAYHCGSMIAKQCMRGDHRRCAAGACTVSIRWHGEVRDAGIAAARAAGASWAVVSTTPVDVEIVGTADDADGADRLLRAFLRSAGRPDDPEARGLVYVVRRSDGGFL